MHTFCAIHHFNEAVESLKPSSTKSRQHLNMTASIISNKKLSTETASRSFAWERRYKLLQNLYWKPINTEMKKVSVFFNACIHSSLMISICKSLVVFVTILLFWRNLITFLALHVRFIVKKCKTKQLSFVKPNTAMPHCCFFPRIQYSKSCASGTILFFIASIKMNLNLAFSKGIFYIKIFINFYPRTTSCIRFYLDLTWFSQHTCPSRYILVC